MGQTAQVHKEIAKLPGVQRIDPLFRAQQSKMLPKEILDKYSDLGYFGTTTKGEPIRGTLATRGDDIAREEVRKGRLPKRGFIRLDPESKVPRDPDTAAALGSYPSMSWYDEDVSRGKDMYSYLAARMQQAASKRPGVRDPRMLEINAMDVRPSSSGWWQDVPSKGKDMYAALYDMIRASGHGNMAETLTDVNKVRRLGNVASHGIGHGDLGFIGPINEYKSWGSGESFSPQLFNQYVDSPGAEQLWLSEMFAHPYKGPDLGKQALDLTPRDVALMTDDEKLGLLFTREAQLSGVHGPYAMRDNPVRYRWSPLKSDDTSGLRNAASAAIQANPGSLSGAFGPHTLGRELTTEETITRLLRGESPEEISTDMIQRAPIDAYRGRYRTGGLVAAIES
jgi:hypothetical protein